MAEKSPHIWPRKRVLPQRTGMEYKRNVIAPTFTHLSTLQKLKDTYIGTFVNEPGWGRLPEATKFHSENSPISTSLPSSNAKPNFTFEAESGSGTCLKSSTICHSFSFSRFEEINFKFFTRAKFHKTKSTHDGQTSSVNSTGQLKSPFDWLSSCHKKPFEYHSQQNEQLATVMSNDSLFILLEFKFEQDSQSNDSQEHKRFSLSDSANNGLCVLDRRVSRECLHDMHVLVLQYLKDRRHSVAVAVPRVERKQER